MSNKQKVERDCQILVCRKWKEDLYFKVLYLKKSIAIINYILIFCLSALAASTDGIPVFKYKRWQLKKQAISEVLEEYKSVKADLNVLPFCSQFIPMDVINFPKSKSIIYHPSILPRHRGASAINWYGIYQLNIHMLCIKMKIRHDCQ